MQIWGQGGILIEKNGVKQIYKLILVEFRIDDWKKRFEKSQKRFCWLNYASLSRRRANHWDKNQQFSSFGQKVCSKNVQRLQFRYKNAKVTDI